MAVGAPQTMPLQSSGALLCAPHFRHSTTSPSCAGGTRALSQTGRAAGRQQDEPGAAAAGLSDDLNLSSKC